MRRPILVPNRDEGWDWLPEHIPSSNDNRNLVEENSPKAVLIDMAFVLAPILIVVCAVIFAVGAR